MKIVHFGDEQPQRGASSALRDRYLATGSHVAKTRSCLVLFFPPLSYFHSHSNTDPPSSMCLHAALLHLSPSFSHCLVKGGTLNGGFTVSVKKENHSLSIHPSFHTCHRVTLSFFSLSPSFSLFFLLL